MGTNVKRYEKIKEPDTKSVRDRGDSFRKTFPKDPSNGVLRDCGDDNFPKAKDKSVIIKLKSNLKKYCVEGKAKYGNTNVININLNKLTKDAAIGQVEKDLSECDEINKTDDVSCSLKINKDNRLWKPYNSTVTASNDGTKVYGAVTFTEKKTCDPLQVKVPSHIAKRETKIPKLIMSNVKTSCSSVKEKTIRRSKRGKKHTDSAVANTQQIEVAKWAPDIDKHTKHYYEAWIDTTLAAISKDKIYNNVYFEKQKFIENFYKALEKANEQDSVGFAAERYLGRIKINHKF